MLRGLNWGHRRARAPMDAVAQAVKAELGLQLVWDQQTLGGFEHGLTVSLAQQYDLIVFDHPFCGDIAAQQMFLPLDAWCASLVESDWIGGSLDSYRYEGRLWGLPVDGATQSCVYRPDLLDDPLPADWDGVLNLATRLRRRNLWMILPTLAPHGLLALLALCANLGTPWPDRPDVVPCRVALREAMRLLKAAHAVSHASGGQMNAIDAHDAMVARDDIVYCPLAYMYLTYAEDDLRRRLRFGPFPGPAGHPGGSVLGGTGLGVSRWCRDPHGAAALLAYLADPSRQVRTFMPQHGQPAAAAAWAGTSDDAARFGGVFAALRSTMESAWVRPRCPGYIGWQARAGQATQAWLRDDLGDRAFEEHLIDSWHTCAGAGLIRTEG